MKHDETDRLIDEALKRINKRLDVVIARQNQESHKPETQGERIENLKKQIIAKLEKLPPYNENQKGVDHVSR